MTSSKKFKLIKWIRFFFVRATVILQTLTEYKSSLPDLLLSFVDSIIKVDSCNIMRYNFVHYKIDQLLREQVAHQEIYWLYLDPFGQKNIIFEGSKSMENTVLGRFDKTLMRETWDDIKPEQIQKLSLNPHPFFSKFFNESQLQSLAKQKLFSIDQIRAKCQANTYFDPEQIIKDIWKIISWNQIFRTTSSSSFIYLSNLYEKILQIINRKKFHKKFYSYKVKDFQRLLNQQLLFKIDAKTWPYIPETFREYQQLQNYSFTPKNRSQHIQKRLSTRKEPIKCPQNCTCIIDTNNNQDFCRYTLKDGWLSQCPNRANKIQCKHDDPQEMLKCKNAEIKKSQRKNCRKSQQQVNDSQYVEESLMWGIDLYTRNIIFHSLPEADIDFLDVVLNKNQKNRFIEQSLLKAINFKGKQGYDLKKVCEFIIEQSNLHQNVTTAEQNLEIQQKKKQFAWIYSFVFPPRSEQKLSEQQIFRQKDRYYAQILLKNYRFCHENIDKDAYRIYTKGKGARCIKKQGIRQGTFIVEYFGQLYQPWRWYEREDFIKEIQKKKKLKNFIPEFYNIYLETHHNDPDGYDLMVVDPVTKGNFSSRFSHSCNPNCGTITTVSDGKYYIAMYSFRDIKYGEELSFDYCCMTESNYQHKNSICLCGMEKCRGNYLQLANTPAFSQLVDKNTCFLSRNSLILGALQDFTDEDKILCEQHNIKQKMIHDAPTWIKKWMTKLLCFIQLQVKMYKQDLKQRWTQKYPWGSDEQSVRQQKIELYAQISKRQLLQIRFQNLFTTADKLKYFLNTIKDERPPLLYINERQLITYLIQDPSSVLQQLQDILIQQKKQLQSKLVQKFIDLIRFSLEDKIKLFYFRLCCLCVSQIVYFIPPTSKFNSTLLADIVYFYAFTHTYFSAHQYKPHVSEEIKVSLQQVTGNPKDAKNIDKIKKRYSSQFVWGQLVSWYKQTIVSPQSSLSQDRRGTLSYPMLNSTINSVYPFEKHCRKNFLKAVREKPSSCWPSAPHDGCSLSFKNPFKCYGTIFFQNTHNAQKLKDLPGNSLLNACLDNIDKSFKQKLQLFKQVEKLISRIDELDEAYLALDHIQSKYFSFTTPLPENISNSQINNTSKPTKKRKGNNSNNSSDQN